MITCPLQWPAGRKKTFPPERAIARNPCSLTTAHYTTERALIAICARDIVISTNAAVNSEQTRAISHSTGPGESPGAVVSFMLHQKRYVLACDHFQRVGDNLHGCTRILESLKLIEKHAGRDDAMRCWATFESGSSQGEIGA